MNPIKRIYEFFYSHIEFYIANRNDANKRAYLRKLGCKVGDKTRFVGKVLGYGSEPYLIEIGSNCLISDNINFHTHDGGVKVLNAAGYFGGKRMDKMGRIKIGDNCFIGSGARIMMGVVIGDNCIIGANSIVTKSIPSNSVVGGVPAKVICTLDDYYHKNLERNVFYETAGLDPAIKKEYLLKHVPEL